LKGKTVLLFAILFFPAINFISDNIVVRNKNNLIRSKKMKCKYCEKETVGKSKYCPEHKVIARNKFIEMISKQKEEKDNDYQLFQDAWDEALKAGHKAATECEVVPMVVQQHKNMLDDNSPVEQSWVVEGGVCGFAWLSIKPGNSRFANWAKKNIEGCRSDSYEGGVCYWIHDYGQSMTRKESFARAMSKVLRERLDNPKVRISARSRMD
jgi:hypothetical protein